mmetsp:Transcript_12687/g.15755  ORF Transcript_12687/g.15755 Transcript_12687/m.15755 type:complete len:109 (-) Transcript_12687:214-540(-)
MNIPNFCILAFPCNQFGRQEPGSNSQIQSFAQKYHAGFQLFAKVDVNGRNIHPVWKTLTDALPGKIKWNFEKFLVGRDGIPVKRYPSTISPLEIEADIRELVFQHIKI